MRFIDILIESMEKALKDFPKKMNELINNNAPKNWCIGSGSSFIVYENITYTKAEEIFKKLNVRMCCGKLIEKKESGYFITETYNTMESFSGQTTLFMFPIEEIRKAKNEKSIQNNKRNNIQNQFKKGTRKTRHRHI